VEEGPILRSTALPESLQHLILGSRAISWKTDL
jgi:hypothetical protein